MKHIKEILDEAIARLEAIRDWRVTDVETDLMAAELAAMEDMAAYNVHDEDAKPKGVK